jgi:hypothetical protein
MKFPQGRSEQGSTRPCIPVQQRLATRAEGEPRAERRSIGDLVRVLLEVLDVGPSRVPRVGGVIVPTPSHLDEDLRQNAQRRATAHAAQEVVVLLERREGGIEPGFGVDPPTIEEQHRSADTVHATVQHVRSREGARGEPPGWSPAEVAPPAPDDPDRGVAGLQVHEVVELSLQLLGQPTVVGVHEGQVPAAGVLDPEVAGSARADPRGRPQDANTGVFEPLRDRDGAVAGCVVDDHEGQVAVRLGQHAPRCLTERLLPVVDRHHHRDVPVVRHLDHRVPP